MPRSVFSVNRLYRYMRAFQVADFSGGWNSKAAPTLLGVNESPDMLNMTLDEQGGISKRLGYQSVATAPGTGTPTVIFWWESGQKLIVQIANVIYASGDLSSWVTLGTVPDNSRVAFTDFAPAATPTLVAVHKIGGVYTSTGASGSWTAISGSPKGNCIATWQNKVWVAGDPNAVARVYASNAGDPTLWTVGTDYNDMREKDNAPITALVSGQGRDENGDPGLMVFKDSWWGRISDPKTGTTFGKYTTLHNEAGASGPEAVCTSMNGQIVSVHEHGIHMSDGVHAPVYVSGKIENVFAPGYLNLTQARMWTCSPWRDRVIVSVTRTGSTYPDFSLEFHPVLGWIVPHSIGFTSLTSCDLGGVPRLLGGSTADGRVFQVFKGWADDGQNIAAHYQTRWFAVAGGYMIRMRRTRLIARGTFDFYTKGDQTEDAGVYNHFVGDLPSIWTNQEHPFDDFFSLGVAKTVSWRVEETSQTTAYGRTLLPSGQPEEIGSFSVYGFLLDYVRLGYS